jgi:cardiolipin synthase A/B
MPRATLAHGILALCALLAFACAWHGPPKTDIEPRTATPVVLAATGQVSKAQAEEAIDEATATAASRKRAEQLVTAIQAQTGVPLIRGNHTRLLIDGPQTYQAMLAAVEKAHDHIHIETYIFADDEVGHRFADALRRKQEEGVAVRIIYDAVGSVASSRAFFDQMAAQGIEIAEFHPLKPSSIYKINNRDHRKLVVIDGSVAFTGGINISSTYSKSSTSDPGPEAGVKSGWRDTQLEVRGPAVKQLQALFVQTWTRLGKHLDPSTRGLYPELDEVGEDLVQVVPSEGGDNSEFRIYTAYLAAIRNATRKIWIQQAYFAPNPELRQELIEAAKRGVDVRIVVPGFTDSRPVYYASRATYGELLENGISLYEHKEALLHAKTAVVDGVWSTVGSCNIDPRSFVHNNELNAAVVSADLARDMEKVFQKDLENSQRIDPKTWSERPASERVLEFMSGLFSYWL